MLQLWSLALLFLPLFSSCHPSPPPRSSAHSLLAPCRSSPPTDPRAPLLNAPYQAPFYLFDEIDAALDPAYRTTVAALLRQQADDERNPAMFVVTTFHPQVSGKLPSGELCACRQESHDCSANGL